MKTKITKDNINLINNDTSIVGVHWNIKANETLTEHLFQKSTIVRFPDGTYGGIELLRMPCDLTRNWTKDSIKDYVLEVIDNSDDHEIYLFEESSKLISWLINENC